MSTQKDREIELAWAIHRRQMGVPEYKRWRTTELRIKLSEAQNWRCPCCGSVMDLRGIHGPTPTFEHLIPRWCGGSDDVDTNIAITCEPCNNSEVAWPIWEEHLRSEGCGDD